MQCLKRKEKQRKRKKRKVEWGTKCLDELYRIKLATQWKLRVEIAHSKL